LLLGFALPPLLQLKEVPALRVIRRDVGPPRQGALAVYIMGLAAVFGLLLWHAGELNLASYVFGGFAAAFGLFAAIAYGALRLIGRFGRTGSVSWRYGLANLLRRPHANAVQIVAIAVGLTAILLLTMIRGDLLDAWRERVPPDAPDRFLVNIQPEQRQALSEFLERNGVERLQAFPMVRARLVAINGKPVGAEDYSEERAKRQIERQFNVTYLSALLESFPASYISSFHAPAGDALLTLRLSQAFPNLTVIDVSVILRQLQFVMDQLIGAVQLVFLFALGAGVLVLYAALLATQDERTHEAAVMRALGASRAQVLAAQRAEFAVLGAIAGLLGSFGATA